MSDYPGDSRSSAVPTGGLPDSDDPLAPSAHVSDLASGLPASGSSSRRSDDRVSKLSVSLTAQQDVWVKNEAARCGLPKTAIIKNLLATAVSGLPIPPPSGASAPAAPAPVAAVAVPAASAPAAVAAAPPPPAPEVRRDPDLVAGVRSPLGGHAGPAGGNDEVYPDRPVGRVSDSRDHPQPPLYSHLPPGVGAADVDPAAGREQSAAEVVDESDLSRAMVLAGQAGSKQMVFVLPGGIAGQPGLPGVPGLPNAQYMVQPGGASIGWFGALPFAVRSLIVGLGVMAVLLGFVYLGAQVVASRYYFQEVSVAPGRSVFYKVDRWSGEMTRCRTDMGAVGVVC